MRAIVRPPGYLPDMRKVHSGIRFHDLSNPLTEKFTGSIFLIASPAYAPGACHLGLCEPSLRHLKLATTSVIKPSPKGRGEKRASAGLRGIAPCQSCHR